MNWANNDHNQYHYDTNPLPPIPLPFLKDNSEGISHVIEVEEVSAETLLILLINFNPLLFHPKQRVSQSADMHAEAQTKHPIKSDLIVQNAAHGYPDRNADIEEYVDSPNAKRSRF